MCFPLTIRLKGNNSTQFRKKLSNLQYRVVNHTFQIVTEWTSSRPCFQRFLCSSKISFQIGSKRTIPVQIFSRSLHNKFTSIGKKTMTCPKTINLPLAVAFVSGGFISSCSVQTVAFCLIHLWSQVWLHVWGTMIYVVLLKYSEKW